MIKNKNTYTFDTYNSKLRFGCTLLSLSSSCDTGTLSWTWAWELYTFHRFTFSLTKAMAMLPMEPRSLSLGKQKSLQIQLKSIILERFMADSSQQDWLRLDCTLFHDWTHSILWSGHVDWIAWYDVLPFFGGGWKKASSAQDIESILGTPSVKNLRFTRREISTLSRWEISMIHPSIHNLQSSRRQSLKIRKSE